MLAQLNTARERDARQRDSKDSDQPVNVSPQQGNLQLCEPGRVEQQVPLSDGQMGSPLKLPLPCLTLPLFKLAEWQKRQSLVQDHK